MRKKNFILDSQINRVILIGEKKKLSTNRGSGTL
jgi:hypothetical protein